MTLAVPILPPLLVEAVLPTIVTMPLRSTTVARPSSSSEDGQIAAGASGDVGGAGARDEDGVALIFVIPAKIARVADACSVRRELGHEGVGAAALEAGLGGVPGTLDSPDTF